MRNWVIVVILLLGTWLLLSADVLMSTTSVAGSIAAGVVVSTAVALLFAGRKMLYKNIRLTPKALVYLLFYPLVFLKALLIANLDVARRVLSPSLPINPAIVEVKTNLISPLGRLVLANSITLTPGTLTVDIQGDSLYIHWIDAVSTDVQSATEKIVRGFETYLEVIYG
ncbi:MAG: Na+/H+ antiporter subunit E [Sphaerochaetaceae bacterium]|nr:Na+/H+ antiporter subunit E [Sphaerochaetaceae bacterium]